MDYLAFGFSDGVGSRSSLSLQNGDQPIERRTSRLWINKLTGRVEEPLAALDARDVARGPAADAATHASPDAPPKGRRRSRTSSSAGGCRRTAKKHRSRLR